MSILLEIERQRGIGRQRRQEEESFAFNSLTPKNLARFTKLA
jgi:hypothetical protein